ncbi:MAG: proton-conducting transporter membrane subunit [Candidatus Omnitrophota bacterium]|jgi:multicomponent Na+:H+ antiporter subunit D
MTSLLVLVPFFSLIVLNFPFKGLMRTFAFFWAALLSLAQIALTVFHPAWFWEGRADNLSSVMFLSIGIVVFISLFVARALITDEAQRANFVNLLFVALIGMNATVMVTDIFSLYVFIEITAVSSFVMIALQKDRLALEGAFKYFIMSAVATAMILSAIALMFFVSGSTSFSAVSAGLINSAGSGLTRTAIALFICGLLIKSGIVPFHGWLPDAYSAAPTPVSVLLAGIITKASGVYVLMRLVISVFGIIPSLQNLLMFSGALSIIVGALAALTQSDFKRMLAYSSISQIGYIILALGCGTPLALFGAAFHIFNHATFKSLLFVNAAAVEKQLGTLDMDKMGGLSAKMPVTGTTSVIAALSTAGIPPLSGFWSKLIIILALWNAGNFIYATVALLASILTLAYFLTLQRKVFFGKLAKGLENVEEADLNLVIPQLILAVLIIGVGLIFPFIFVWH